MKNSFSLLSLLLVSGCSSNNEDKGSLGNDPQKVSFDPPVIVYVPEHNLVQDNDAGCLTFPATDASTSVDSSIMDSSISDAGIITDAGMDVIEDSSVIVDSGPKLKPRVFAYGNSLVWGSAMSYPAVLTDRFPAQLSVAMGSDWQSDLWMGRGGWTTSSLITAGPHDLEVPNLETNRTVKVLVFWEGVNEMGNPWQCEAYEHMARARVAEGWKVILVNALIASNTTSATLPDGGSNPASWLKLFHDFNACVAANAAAWGASGVVDLTTIPELQDPFNKTYYIDGTHLTKLGYAAVVNSVKPMVQALYIAP